MNMLKCQVKFILFKFLDNNEITYRVLNTESNIYPNSSKIIRNYHYTNEK